MIHADNMLSFNTTVTPSVVTKSLKALHGAAQQNSNTKRTAAAAVADGKRKTQKILKLLQRYCVSVFVCSVLCVCVLCTTTSKGNALLIALYYCMCHWCPQKVTGACSNCQASTCAGPSGSGSVSSSIGSARPWCQRSASF